MNKLWKNARNLLQQWLSGLFTINIYMQRKSYIWSACNRFNHGFY